jgi:hypothetical protein
MIHQPRVAVLLIGDGRDFVRAATVESFVANAANYSSCASWR